MKINIFIALCFFIYPTISYADLKTDVKNINDEIKREEASVSKISAGKKTLASKLEALSQNIERYKRLSALLEADIKKNSQALDNINRDIKTTLKTIVALRREALKNNIFIIDNLGYSDIKIIISSKNDADTLKTLEILSIAINNMGQKVGKLKEASSSLENLLKEENTRKAELIALKKEREAALINLKAERAQYSNTMALLKNDEAAKKEYIELLQFKRRSFEDELQNIAKKSDDMRVMRDKSFEKFKGRLNYPITHGAVVERYGNKLIEEAGVMFFNKGIKIKPARTSDIFAVCEGEVIFADFIKGHDNLVVVRHSTSYYSVYANISYLQISAGDRVDFETVLGFIDTDDDPNAKLYFELRRGEDAIEPTEWLKKGSLR